MGASRFPVAVSHAELFEKFDARMGPHQWQHFMTQLPGWRNARDAQGRTLLMVGLASTKGRHPSLYLAPDAADCLQARDQSGRGLVNYAWALRFTFAASTDQDHPWARVFRASPGAINPLSDRGVFVDSLLNPMGFRSNDSGKHFLNVLDAGLSVSLGGNGQLSQWIGRGFDVWWRCPEHEHQALFDALVLRMPWARLKNGAADMEQACWNIKAPSECLNDLPEPVRAFFALADLMMGQPDRYARGIEALETGLLPRYLDTRFDRFDRALRRANTALQSNPTGAKRERRDAGEWLASLRTKRLDQALPEALPARPKRRF